MNKKKLIPTLYIASIIMVVALSAILRLMNNFAKAPTNIMTQETKHDSERIGHILSDMEESFVAYNKMINAAANTDYKDTKEWFLNFEQQVNILFGGFLYERPYISGMFLHVTAEEGDTALQVYKDYEDNSTSLNAMSNDKANNMSLLSKSAYIVEINNALSSSKEPIYKSTADPSSENFTLSHIAPLFIEDEYRGFFGAVFNLSMLDSILKDDANSARHLTLLTKDLEIISTTTDNSRGVRLDSFLDGEYQQFAQDIAKNTDKIMYYKHSINGKTQMDIAIKMPTGQIFIESFNLASKMADSNILIVFLAVYALVCIILVQKKEGTGLFDFIARTVIGNIDEIKSERKISIMASFAMQLSLAFVSFAFFVFNIIGESTLLKRVAYGTVFIICAILLIYKQNSRNIKITYLYIIGYLSVPVILHHVSGGFASPNAGQVIIFCIFTVILSRYILNREQSAGVFSLFVALLFLDAILEILYLPSVEGEYVIRWVTVIFILGFGVYIITDLYVTEVHELFSRLKDTQSVLIKKEKMVTLGTLMAGIAHEINTPLGAIKASVEGMESSMNSIYETLVLSGRSLSDGDMRRLNRLHDAIYESLTEMYTTSEIRKSKPVLKEYFSSMGFQDPDSIVEKMIRLEFCNIDRIKSNEDIFFSPNINELLNIVIKTLPLTKGSYVIRQSTGRASKIVFALKSYSHTTLSSDPVWFSLIQNIDNVLILMYNSIKRQIELVKDFDEDIPNMLGNPDELGQVWINLIQNAVYAIDEIGGGILTIAAKRDNNMVNVSITDTGKGIDADLIDQIFEPFYTTKAVGEGSGLGLDICKKIVESHNGKISVCSTKGQSTTFTVTLPFGG